MQTRIIRLEQKSKALEVRSVLTIGNFDGIHKGHAALLAKLKEAQRSNPGTISVVQSLYPHPQHVFNPQIIIRPILSLRQKAGILSDIGIDLLALVHFTRKVSQLGAREFMENFWIRIFKVKHVVLGADAALGRGREGNITLIKDFCQEKGIDLTVVDFVKDGERKLGSREIRRAITEGRFSDARSELGRYFSIEGRVVGGDKRGRKLGFPTANIFTKDSLLPQGGVFACRASLGGKKYDTVVNIGVRPTFGGEGQVVEAHLLGYDGPDFYGSRIEISFISSIRKEQKFTSVDALKAQIARDITQAQEILARDK